MFAADTAHPNKTLQAKLDHIFILKKGGRIDLTIRPEYFALLDRLGNPHRHLPPVIHVAGTNGKGSTIAFMRAILEAAGYRVHVYTSPHLLRFNERIVLAGQEITDPALETLLDEMLDKNTGMEQTFFEITTALALTAFARVAADIVLLETGLGGRFDSTNVIDRPLATVITTLSLDHTEFLGNTVMAIAGEKAGIIKSQTPCIVAHQPDLLALPVIAARAAALGSPLYSEDNGWVLRDGDRVSDPFTVQAGAREIRDLPLPALPGAHQMRNAATAIATLVLQDRFPIPDDAFRQGMRSVSWPARLQRIDSASLPPGWELWLDGGHNDSAAAVLADQARAWAAQDGKPLHIITGMMAHKDAAAFAAPLAKLAASVTCIRLDNGYAPEELARIWCEAGAGNVISGESFSQSIKDIVIPSVAEGSAMLRPVRSLGYARDDSREDVSAVGGRILLTGSLYLAQLTQL